MIVGYLLTGWMSLREVCSIIGFTNFGHAEFEIKSVIACVVCDFEYK